MKRNLLLGLLLSGSLPALAKTAPPPLVQFSCLESATSSRVSPKTTLVAAPSALVQPPTTPGPTQASCSGVINVNIHFMLRLDGSGNFNETNNGFAYKPWNANKPLDPTIPADTASNGYARARALLASYAQPVARGGIWNLASLYAFAAGQSYYVALTATRNSGQSHTLGRVIQVTTDFDPSCIMSAPVQSERE